METVDFTSFASKFKKLKDTIRQVILGQDKVVEDLLIAALARGHVLLEGAPGLGKTRLVRALSESCDLSFGRIQFTPDLMPADVTGTQVLVEDKGSTRFEFQKGPIFNQIVLADEINRATPKTQSALLEAMQERSVTASGKHYDLERPFMVLATQNPIEMEGTYPLPEAQLDRFLFKINIERPDKETLKRILLTTTGSTDTVIEAVFKRKEMLELQKMLRAVPIAERGIDYIVNMVDSSHNHPMVRLGASPRGAQAIALAAKGYALASSRPNVELEDIKRAALPALRHRILLSFEAEVEAIAPDTIINEILNDLEL